MPKLIKPPVTSALDSHPGSVHPPRIERLKQIIEAVLIDFDSEESDAPDSAAIGWQSQPQFFKGLLHRLTIRHQKFGACRLFEDPAWTILVDLYVSTTEGQKVSISSACIASNVPTSTALRWIAALEKADLVVRTSDRTDARRSFLNLTAKAHAMLTDYYRSCTR